MAAPPYMPECKSLFGPVILISSPNRPRSMVTIAGVLLSNNPVSQINTMSDVSSAAFSFIKGIKLGDPLSSSPSKKKVILQGNVPCTAFHARQASTKVINCPLSSDDPRPRITGPLSVCSTAGSNGSRCHSSMGSTG